MAQEQVRLVPGLRPQFGRRSFIKGTLLVASGLATGLAAVRMRPKDYGGYRGLQVLGTYQADVVHGFAEAVLPSRPGYPDVLEANVVPRLDEELFFVDEHIRGDFLAAIMLIELLPLRYGYFSRFSRLPREARVRFLRDAQASGNALVNTVVLAAGVMIRYLYYGNEKTWARIGYDGPFGKLPQKPSEQRLYYRSLNRRHESPGEPS